MEIRQKSLFCFIILIFIAFLSTSIVHCVGLGISPSAVNLPAVLRGGYAEANFVLSNPSKQDIAFLVEFKGDEVDWFSFEPFKSGIMPAGSTLNFKVIAQPPSFVPVGNYSANIILYAAPTEQVGGGTGTRVIAGIAVPVKIEISDIEVLHYTLRDVYVPLSEECYPIRIYFDVENDGNVRVAPRFDITLMNTDKKVIKEINYTAETLLPTVRKNILAEVPYQIEGEYHCVPKGNYYIGVKAYIGDEKIADLTRKLEILERGAITLRGEIKNLTLPTNTSVGQITKISANFTNKGEVEVGTKLKAEIYLNGTLMDMTEGDIVRIWQGDSQIISTYFTPKKEGIYNITAWAVFEGKMTEPLTSSILVTERQFPILEIAIAAAIIVGIVLALFWWRKHRS